MSNTDGNDGSDNLEARMDVFHFTCRQEGLYITPQRVAIYRLLLETDEHPSADMVFRALKTDFPNISLDTVHRTLQTLAEIGVASVMAGSGDARRFDANLGNHPHFKCLKCGRIVDFSSEPLSSVPTPESISKNFKVLKKTVYFEGICHMCPEEPGS
ncbi:MAG: Fur family transcriptional regulator [Planctomycetota bacterium]|jgi:Fur family peroxide stress response transcriptional regulator